MIHEYLSTVWQSSDILPLLKSKALKKKVNLFEIIKERK